MKVLHINCNYMSTALHQTMVEHLDALDVKSTVFAPVCSFENALITPNENVVTCKCFHKWDRIWFYYKQRKIKRALKTKISVGEFDLFHAYTLFTDGNCAYELSKEYNIPYVVAVRNTDVNTFFKWMPHLRSRGVEILSNAKAVFFLSETYKKQVLGEYIPSNLQDVLEAKSYVIPNGIDDFWLNNSIVENKGIDTRSGIKLIYAGRIDKNKNIPTTQKAMAILSDRGINTMLTVVGRIEEKKEYLKIIADKRTRYLPAMPKEKLIEEYKEADIFVMPSFTESFGLVYAEAMSQGLPVIYSKGQGFDNQFAEGEVGYHADATSAESVANAILSIVQNYEKITYGLPDKAQRYEWSAICQEYYKIYQSLIEI